MWYRVVNGLTLTPLAMTRANFGQQAWRFGPNETPEVYNDGAHLAQMNERLFGNDLALQAVIGLNECDARHDERARPFLEAAAQSKIVRPRVCERIST